MFSHHIKPPVLPYAVRRMSVVGTWLARSTLVFKFNGSVF